MLPRCAYIRPQVILPYMKVYRMTEKGQVTVPVDVRRRLGIDPDSLLEIRAEGDEVRIRKVGSARPLAPEDPIWSIIGAAESGLRDVSERHDDYLAAGEVEGWHASSRTRARPTRSSTVATGTTRGRSRSRG